ncbi:AAA family ATPase [Bariatricus sp. SGI.154]|uniref:AAA family ATPase n=1 Tax=Bariatricus sp. SGI.154 TaxID=3420549 RepID=UPI003CFC5DC6
MDIRIEKFGEHLRRIRNARGYTQEVLAEKLGITRSVYAGYELGTYAPDLVMLVKMADALEVSTDILLQRDRGMMVGVIREPKTFYGNHTKRANGIYLNPGSKGFEIARNSKIYVDKTGLLRYTNRVIDTEQRFMCVSRPRRFGKSMAAQMLLAYYGKRCDSKELFHGLEIEKDDSYMQHLNQYDVLFFEMQRFLQRAETPENLVSYLEKTILKELSEIYGDYVNSETKDLVSAFEAIEKMTGSGFIFVIDEWDCIFRETKNNTIAQKVYLDFLKDLFKGQTYVKLVYMTGILPIKKYGTHSTLNMFYEYSMIDPKEMAAYTGFTEQEVEGLCEQYGMDFEEAKKWYDGYYMRGVGHVYGPKSIVDAMLNQTFQSYWVNTETYEALKIYMDMNYDGLKDAIIGMLGGGRIKINYRRFQNDMTTFKSKDDVLTLLVHLGYLAYDRETREVFIPNLEIAEEFQNALEGETWSEISQVLEESEQLLDATLCGDEEAVARGIDTVHMENTSLLAYNDENSLSCVITLAYYSARRDYVLHRELASGQGYADVVFRPRRHSNKPAIIVELKWDKSAESAIEQIKKKKYKKALEDYKGDLLLVGINYNKSTKVHECRIEKIRI